MLKPEEFKFKKKKLFVLSTFGHCGIDYLHSLLDNHKQIIIIPSLSFYRKLEIFEKKNYTKKLKKKIYISKFVDFILKANKQTMRHKIFKNSREKKNFKSYIFEYLKYKKKFTIKKDLFESIHYAYARVKNFNQNKKIIVAHEHAPWNCFDYESYFDAKYILIIRDPRASIAGSIKYLQRAKKNPSSYDIDLALGFFWSALTFYKNIRKKKIFIFSNEKMNLNLNKEMRKLSRWLGITFNTSLTRSTLLGKNWFGESAYLSIGDLKKKLPKDYYDIKLVQKRWSAILSKNQIKQIELFFKEIFKIFKYKKKYSLSSFEKIIHISRFFLNLDFNQGTNLKNFLNIPKLIIRRFCLIFFNKISRKLFLI